MTTTTDLQHILIGTAGHIDHGKTRLVGRLTDINTDRLPEEQARGISIDLGFAHWQADEFQFGIVDVPGHERFVKNMVAGATGIDVALLVIAADDSVMPQTREHLEIMDLLGVRAGLIAITKTDLVDPDFVELVEAEIEEVVAGTFLEGCPIVPVSSETGAGIEELKQTVLDVARRVELPTALELFRMPIDRVFSITGHGTVVTGSVMSGDVQPGATLELLPAQREVRVRSVENHGTHSQDAGVRQRTAINLAGVKAEEVLRGQELATPGFLQPTTRMLVEIRALSSSPMLLRDRLELNLHIGTCETLARLNLKGEKLKPGGRAYAELRLKDPVAAAYGQRFILRRTSPALTIAGGRILDPQIPAGKRIKDLHALGESLANPDVVERLAVCLGQRDAADLTASEAAWKVGVPPDRYDACLQALADDKQLVQIGAGERRLQVHTQRLDALASSVLRTIHEELERHQPRRALPRNTLIQACKEITRSEILDAVFDYLLKKKRLVHVGPHLGPTDLQVKLTKKQQALRTQLLEQIGQAGLTPPTTKELASDARQDRKEIETLLNLCVEDMLLVKAGDALYFAPAALEQARATCQQVLGEQGEATMSQLREAWGVSRKFAVPVCEHFDALGVTIRAGDVRKAGPAIETELDV